MLSQKQIACLLANAFFCTFPGRKYDFSPLLFTLIDDKHRSTKGGEKDVGQKYPSINFSDLFMSPLTGQRKGKLQCMLNYFYRVSKHGEQALSLIVIQVVWLLFRTLTLCWRTGSSIRKRVLSATCAHQLSALGIQQCAPLPDDRYVQAN